MKAAVRLERPEQVEVTITVTMPLAAWKLVRRDLVSLGGKIAEPTRELSQSIAELVVQTEQTILRQEPERKAEAAEPTTLPHVTVRNIAVGDPITPQDYELPAATPAPSRRRPAAGAAP